jgi:hypothetical protein
MYILCCWLHVARSLIYLLDMFFGVLFRIWGFKLCRLRSRAVHVDKGILFASDFSLALDFKLVFLLVIFDVPQGDDNLPFC